MTLRINAGNKFLGKRHEYRFAFGSCHMHQNIGRRVVDGFYFAKTHISVIKLITTQVIQIEPVFTLIVFGKVFAQGIYLLSNKRSRLLLVAYSVQLHKPRLRATLPACIDKEWHIYAVQVKYQTPQFSRIYINLGRKLATDTMRLDNISYGYKRLCLNHFFFFFFPAEATI